MTIGRFIVSALMATVFVFAAQNAQAEDAVALNVNTATVEELSAVPGLNADLAKAIVAYREEMGDIQNLDELADVPGFSKDLLGKVRSHLAVDAISGAECSC